MITKRDLQLGKIALRAGMVTKEQLAKSLAIQKKLEKKVGLGAILIKKGYINRDQLEEIVRRHNEQKDGAKNGASSIEKPADAPRKAKKKKRKKKAPAPAPEAPASEDAAKPAAEVEDRDVSAPPEESKKGKPRKGDRASGEKVLERTGRKSDEGSVSDAGSEVDAALFESASDVGKVATDDPSRRVVTCTGCGKSYRVKKKQTGKRFPCRKCKARVRIPKDLFDHPAAGSKASGAGVKVEEFSLGSSDDATGSGDDKDADQKTAPGGKKGSGSQVSAPGSKKSGGATALAAPPAAKKELSIADLAKAAAERKAAPLGPRVTKGQRILGYVQAALALVLACGIGGGIYYWRWSLEQERLARAAADEKLELDRFAVPFDAAVKTARELIARARDAKGAPPSDLVASITNALSALELARQPIFALRPKEPGKREYTGGPVITIKRNVDRALALDDAAKPDELTRDLFLERGKLYLGQGGENAVHEAVHDFGEIVGRDPRCDEAFLLLGRAELRRRNYAAAVDALRKASSLKAEPRTHLYLGLALEAGDVTAEAVREYDQVPHPLAKLLKARAQLEGGELDAAQVTVSDALAGLGADGDALGAAHVIRALALERKGDLDGADKAFDAAVAAGGPSGRASVARGERRLRAGRYEEAAQDFDAALKATASCGARAAIGLGDARAGQLDVAGARTAYGQALTLPVVASSALVLGEVDAFDDARTPAPHGVALRRTGQLALGAGRIDEARASFVQAFLKDPFDPETRAAQVQGEVSAKSLAAGEVHAKAARALLRSARDKGASGEPPLVHGPAAASVLLVEAIFWNERGELAKAQQALDDAVAADPGTAGSRAFALKGWILRKRGVEDQARVAFLKALELETAAKDAAAHFYAEARDAVEKARGGDPALVQKARVACDAVLTLVPRHAHALCLRGQLAIHEKKWDEATRFLTAAVEANDYFLEGKVTRGFYYVRDLPVEHRNEQTNAFAVRDFEESLRLDANRADVYLGRGLAKWFLADERAALENAEQAIKLDPRLAAAYRLRSEVHRQAGQNDKADADAKKAEELSRNAERP